MGFDAVKKAFRSKPAKDPKDYTPEEYDEHVKKYGPPLNMTSSEMRKSTYSQAGVLGAVTMALGS
ncbi:uncharacterized protein LDX57_010469 [Aspergillus melleus]|uniref:uncharacterized protein n=1 Tax=Aspergillus melleus TaxID=138277 RepID=UPI001E8DDE1F|nr:uncharacterized protein LDX57_010469 [Aspergillus melleus]KAH8432839.1 hypothetical protein LDX57_010469 [Aspergillus melleus]